MSKKIITFEIILFATILAIVREIFRELDGPNAKEEISSYSV